MRWLVLILSIYALARFCHHQTAGFSMAKIKDNTIEMNVDSPNLDLHGKFRYLGRGLQSFSFLSEDGQTVLKIMSNRYQNRLFWLQFCPFKNWRKEKEEQALYKLKRNFTSYAIAFEELKEETGLIYFHPNKTTTLKQSIILIDKLGIEHSLDLDSTAFLVQKKAVLFYPYIESLMKNNELAKAKQALDSFVSLLKVRCEKGIGNNDSLIRTNFGFSEDKPIHIDVGPFFRNESLKEKQTSKIELNESTLNLKHWLEGHYPALAEHFNEVLENN